MAPHGTLWLGFALLGLAAGSVRAQVVTEFGAGITASSQPEGITTGPDGNLWFTERLGNQVGRITPAGVVTEFKVGITANADPEAICVGSDGNLWFTEGGFAGKSIGRITTAGVVTEFPMPIALLADPPFGITSGPDNNLWFTTNAVVGGISNGAIGRVTTSGVYTIFTAGITGHDPSGIVAGPDGNLWFTETTGTKIGRITTAGVVTEFTTNLTAAAGLASIAVGSDGNLWFTESNNRAIGSITTAGAITEFTAGISNTALPIGIAGGSDGNLWFTEGNSIGRITTVGTVSEFASGITPGAATYAITSGPDGNLWFTENGADQIGVINPSTTSFTGQTATGTGSATVSFSGGGGGCHFITAAFIPLTGGPSSPPPGSAPPGVTFPQGLLDFAASGCAPSGTTLAFTVVYPQPLPPGSVYWKYGPTLGLAAHWYQLPATIVGNTATFSIVDGGLGDDDLAANGTIVEPGGAGTPEVGASFHPLTPCRVADTRGASGPFGGPALQPNATRSFDVGGVCSIPAGAVVAISANLTVTNVKASGELVVFPSDIAKPNTSSLSFRTALTRANNAVVALSGSATTFSVFNNSAATVDFIIDINGYFQ